MFFLLSLLLPTTSPAFTDTEKWMGAEYTPAAAPGNGYWWQWYDAYEPSVARELPMLKRHMGLTTMRVWLMYGVYKANPERLLQNMDKFLTIADDSNITVRCACACACACAWACACVRAFGCARPLVFCCSTTIIRYTST